MNKRYLDILQDMRDNAFLQEQGNNADTLIELTRAAVEAVVSGQGDGPLFPSHENRHISQIATDAEIHTDYTFDHVGVVRSVSEDMQRSVKSHSPYMVKNIIPQPHFVYLSTYLAASLYMGNAVTGEDAGEGLKNEIACAAAFAKLAGMDPNEASGVFTFGGTGTNLYAIKVGLAKALPNHLLEGMGEQKAVVIGNVASHYSQQTSANWTGIGQDNYRQVKTNLDQTTNLEDLERVCREVLSEGKRIACIEAVGGTTSNTGMDDVEAIHEIRERLVRDFSLEYTPHIHVDSVLGWVWLNFIGYNFESNPLGFSERVLRDARHNANKAAKFHFADSFGIDFHKTGYIPYNSSMVVFKNREDFNLLKRHKDIMTPLFHDDEEYNPGIYTLETSRSTANIIATWKTVQSLGREGYQVLLGHALEMRDIFVQQQERLNAVNIIIENADVHSTDIFLRFINSGHNAFDEHQKELYDEGTRECNTQYTSDFYKWFIQREGEYPRIAFSKSSASFYNHNGSPMVALRLYLLGVNTTPETIQFLIDYIIDAKNEFDELRLKG